MIYNSTYGVFQGCTPGGWMAFHDTPPPPADPCDGSPSAGDVCADGSVYAGLSPDGNVKMFTTPADAPGTYPWNNGTSNWLDTAIPNGFNNTGAANTAVLASLSDAASPYEAAAYCDGLDVHGHQDWYLPSAGELQPLSANRAAIGGFNASAFYWSSSEQGAADARTIYIADGQIDPDSKASVLLIRCVRKE